MTIEIKMLLSSIKLMGDLASAIRKGETTGLVSKEIATAIADHAAAVLSVYTPNSEVAPTPPPDELRGYRGL